MIKKPAVLIFRSAGFLVLFGFALTSLACMVEEEKSATTGLTSGPGDVNAEVLAACTAYCDYIYSTATDCDVERLEVEGAGCRAFCSVQAQSIPNQCEDLFFDHYSCVIDESLTFTCESETASPQSAEDTCEEASEMANNCWTTSAS